MRNPCLDMNVVLLTIIASVLLLGSGLGQVPTIEVGTRYSTRDVQTGSQESTGTYIASGCGQLLGKAINVTVLLNNNPSWLPQKGVIYFYVVDSQEKSEDEALCSNYDSSGAAVPFCLVGQWSTGNDVFVKTTAGQVAAIAFTMTLDVMASGLDHKEENRLLWSPHHTFPRLQAGPYYLTQTVRVSTTQQLAYLQEVILDVSFCPNEDTTDRYTIESTAFGVDGASSFTQYVCKSLPCQIDSSDVVIYNGNQLPSNTIILATTNAQWKRLYVLLVGWGGNYDSDPAINNYVGNFQYAATIMRSP